MKRLLISAGMALSALFLIGCASNSGTAAPSASVAPIVNPDPSGTVDLLDGFEEGMYWQAVAGSWNSDDCSEDISESSDWASEGSTSALFEYHAGSAEKAANGGDKATFFCDSLVITDLTEYKDIVLDVNNTTSGTIDFVVVIQDTNWAWCQSAPQTLGNGVNKNVTFSLKDMNIPDPSAVHRMCVCLFQENDGPIAVDNIRLVK